MINITVYCHQNGTHLVRSIKNIGFIPPCKCTIWTNFNMNYALLKIISYIIWMT